MESLCFLLLVTLFCDSFACPREPSPYHSKVAKLSGDNGFKIKINENPDGYIPGKVYTGQYRFTKALILITSFFLSVFNGI